MFTLSSLPYPPTKVTGIQTEPQTELVSVRIDSMGSVMLVERISRELGMPVTIEDFYEATTVNGFAFLLFQR